MIAKRDTGLYGQGGDDEEGYPESCPIYSRINFRGPDDHCDHYWATIYDGEMTDGPYSNEFERLWSLLDAVYQDSDEERALHFLEHLRMAGLERIAQALVDTDKMWWLNDLEHKNFIDAQPSLASGTGWNLYQAAPGWFDATMADLKRAATIAATATP